MIEVVRAGPALTVQDGGRPGWAHLGVPRSGALDATSLFAANRLVGNSDDTAGLEITLLGCVLRFHGDATIAVTGAPATIMIGERIAAFGSAVAVRSGDLVAIGPASAGVRSYLAVAGGIDVEPVLGSRSTDTLSGLGPAPLRAGDLLPIGTRRGTPSDPGQAPTIGGDVTLGLRLGPRDDWFTGAARVAIVSSAYRVTVVGNRVGARLAGPALTRAEVGELPSEGLVLGAVQVLADGQPLVFLADHPITGGYPVIGVVEPACIGLIAQARPGTRVWFRKVGHGSER